MTLGLTHALTPSSPSKKRPEPCPGLRGSTSTCPGDREGRSPQAPSRRQLCSACGVHCSSQGFMGVLRVHDPPKTIKMVPDCLPGVGPGPPREGRKTTRAVLTCMYLI